MNINIIGVPIFYGSDKQGPENAPNKLRKLNFKSLIEKHDNAVYDLGNVHVPEIATENKFAYNSKMKYADTIIEVNNNLAQIVYSSLNSNCFPFIVGGDHSLGLGSICGASKYHDDFAVIWMDAHGDINTDDTSDSGNVHGMPLGAAMGFGNKELVNVYSEGAKINPKNVFILGARDLDTGELNLIKDNNLNVYDPQEMKKIGLKTIVCNILNDLNKRNIKNIHLSFDLDFIDSSFVPGTGTPVSNGFTVDETKTVLKEILNSGLVKSMDFVEFNTALDKNEITAKLALDLIDFTFKNLK